MKHVKLFEQFAASGSSATYYKDVTRTGESVFLFHEEDSIWYGIFPNDVAEELRDVSEAYKEVAVGNGAEENLYDNFIDGREGLAYIEWESGNEWRACTPEEINVDDYEYISMPDGTDVQTKGTPKYGGLPLFALERGMITHYQGNHGTESMSVDDFFDHLDDESDRWAGM
jgi:hypothetical protein